MARGRIFPIRNPSRSFPFDPMQNGENDRNAPLPFQLGAGSSVDIETTVAYRVLLQTSITAILDPNNTGSAVVSSCSSITNQFCVPTGTITKDAGPVGTIRCAIT